MSKGWTYDEFMALRLEPRAQTELEAMSDLDIRGHTDGTRLVLDSSQQAGLLFCRLTTTVQDSEDLGCGFVNIVYFDETRMMSLPSFRGSIGM